MGPGKQLAGPEDVGQATSPCHGEPNKQNVS